MFRPNRVAVLVAVLAVLGAGATASAGDFDPSRGRRVLGAALASSAVEHSGGEDVSTPRNPDRQLLMFLIDPRYNAYLWARPETLPHVFDRMSEPGFLIAAYQAAMTPEAYLHFVKGFTDIEKMRGYFEIVDPRVFQGWATALAGPDFWLAIHGRLADPGKIENWRAFAAGNRWNQLFGPVVSPVTWIAWPMSPFMPNTWRQLEGTARMFNPMQPAVVGTALLESSRRALGRFAEVGVGVDP